MLLDDVLRNQGSWLFRRRGYLPFLLLPVAVVAFIDSAYFPEVFSDTVEEVWHWFCLAVSMTGLGVRCLTIGYVPKGTSGRNTSAQRAHTLNTTGPYSAVRNPLYLGNYLVFLGFVLAIKVWWFVLLASLIFAAYYERIILAEELFLRHKFGKDYEDWAARTPAFLPNLRLWRRSDLPFSLRNVLRREYNGLFLIVAYFTANEAVYDLWIEHESFSQWIAEDSAWIVFFAVGSIVFLVLRTLKRHSRVLNVPGR